MGLTCKPFGKNKSFFEKALKNTKKERDKKSKKDDTK